VKNKKIRIHVPRVKGRRRMPPPPRVHRDRTRYNRHIIKKIMMDEA
jgi:hypothetical protein